MKTESQHELPMYERIGQFYRIHINHATVTDDENNTRHVYDTCKVPVLATRSERIEALIATRYTVAQELAAINNGDDEYQEYQDFRELCKTVADQAP